VSLRRPLAALWVVAALIAGALALAAPAGGVSPADDLGATPTTIDTLTATGLAAPARSEIGATRSPTQLQLTTPPVAPTTTTTTTMPPPPPPWELPPNSGTGRRVVYSKTNQWVWAIEADGRIVKDHVVSGRRTWDQPLPGEYRVFSRSGFTCNIKNPSLCWRYMVRFTVGPDGDNIGFHEIPIDRSSGEPVQGEWQLGEPLSGGCVRQATADALFIWNFAPIGTKVVVLP